MKSKKKHDAEDSAPIEHQEVQQPDSPAETPAGETTPVEEAAAGAVAVAEADAAEVAEALEAVGEKSGGEAAVEAAEAAAAETPQEFTEEQYGIQEKPADSESERHRLLAMVEAAVYVSEEPLTPVQLSQALNQPRELIDSLLAELVEAYAAPHHGIAVREVAGGFKVSTKPEYHEDIRTFVKKLRPPLKLSLAALETLAVVAYKQPITGPEILEIRGVQGGGVLKTLLERKLITAAGRKQVVGKPVLYKTTKDFLVQFGLKDLSELPTLKEFEEWSRLALGDDGGEALAAEQAPPSTPDAAPPADEAAPDAAASGAAAAGAAATAVEPAEEQQPQTPQTESQ